VGLLLLFILPTTTANQKAQKHRPAVLKLYLYISNQNLTSRTMSFLFLGLQAMYLSLYGFTKKNTKREGAVTQKQRNRKRGTYAHTIIPHLLYFNKPLGTPTYHSHYKW